MTVVSAGQVVGNRYKTVSLLGEGGFGEVWKAEDESLGRMVALKIVTSEKLERGTPEQQKEFIERFKREARILATLKHIHILPLFDYGESEGLRYLVIPWHEGGTLEARLQRSKFTLAETDRYFTQLTEALDYAHKQKIIHRDLKPSNVLLDENDNVMLSDFGISKLLEEGQRLTQTGTAIGTPDYMSPEQFRGLSLDGRSDVYSLGVMLYEMAVGQPPFEADNKWTLAQKHISEMPPIPSTVNSTLSPEIDEVILKAMAKEPGDRFNTPSEFLAAWKKAIGQPEVARSVAPTGSNMPTYNLKSDTATKRSGLSPILLGGAVVVVLAVVVIIGSFFALSNMNSATPTGGTALVSATKVTPPTEGPAATATLPLTPTQTIPKIVGTAERNKVSLQIEAPLGSSVVIAIIENKNLINHTVQVANLNTPDGAFKAAVLSQPSGFQFPVNPAKESFVLGPNQKETVTLTYTKKIIVGDKINFQYIKSDVDPLSFSVEATFKNP